MTKLELSTNELVTLKEMLEGDMERTPWSEVEYDDVGLMQYFLDRATMLVKVREELGT